MRPLIRTSLTTLATLALIAAAGASTQRGRFIIAENGQSFSDPSTGLTWERFERDARPYYGDLPAAFARCAALDLDGGGWRLPSAKELLTIYLDDGQYDEELFGRPLTYWVKTKEHWSSTAWMQANAYVVGHGMLRPSGMTNEALIRCVKP